MLLIKINRELINKYKMKKEEGKKIGYSDGLRAIYCILKYR